MIKQIKINYKNFKNYFRFLIKIFEILKKNKIYIIFQFKFYKIQNKLVKNNLMNFLIILTVSLVIIFKIYKK